MLFKLFLFNLILISSSFASLIKRFSNEIENAKEIVDNARIWCVLVARSDGYGNYRHQADVLHAYQLVRKIHQIPKEQVILMMYDDIANNYRNPFKGNVINYPNGENLYTADIEKDYIKNDVTPENFLKVLTKDKKLIDQGKKVLNSTKDDFVFIYTSGHGGRYFLNFPSDYLKANKLNKALKTMQENQMYSKMAIYVEACEAGSMFIDEFKPLDNVYVTTASNERESSWAIFYDSQRGTHLADEYSINWLLDSYAVDKGNKQETLFKQYLNVKNKTLKSHVTQYGDFEMAHKEVISEFQGHKDGTLDDYPLLNLDWSKEELNPVPNDDVEFWSTKINSEANQDDSFERLVEGRKKIDELMDDLKTKFAKKLNVKRDALSGKENCKFMKCYDELLDNLHNCSPLHENTYLLRHLYLFSNTCNLLRKMNTNVKVSDLTKIISEECSKLNKITKNTKIV